MYDGQEGWENPVPAGFHLAATHFDLSHDRGERRISALTT
jgi:hypothetical protein